MAQTTRVLIVDDLDGNELPEGQGQTVTFALDGTGYEIDLSKKNADKLRADFKRYVDAARKVSRRGSVPGPRKSREDSSAIREWAKKNGHEVSERGRIPTAVIQAYEAAN
ncbi:histone-like nucleoid-structuring protein Lsr2 [Blastococcus goldschmidtiae]|uniref:Lsr2 family protein n=1 Tax=Blastococcus goldschmidtiae TaxID=3075546 RepID=A0ABU2K7X9_9ACTN|nr:Lsr2 family protein [Blastococcus sp. DSM 46792]MDT0276285.1 Lsr2 family protein [Blastococcus sp. DSM 46792]